MSTPLSLQQALDRAIAQLLRPLCRVMLRYSVSFNAFEALAKRVYVDVAMREFGIPGKKPSISRVSILSGLTRKDVQRLMQEPLVPGTSVDDDGDVLTGSTNRAARVLSGWARDVAFHDEQGQPAALPVHGDTPSFSELVRRHSGDMPVRAILDELLRVGAVHKDADGTLTLVQQGFVPGGDVPKKIAFLGEHVSDLIATIDHNLQHGGDDAHFQRRVMYQDMPAGCVPDFKRLSAAQAQGLLVLLDQWLFTQTQVPAQDGAGPTVRLGMGVYYFEERSGDAPAQGVSS